MAKNTAIATDRRLLSGVLQEAQSGLFYFSETGMNTPRIIDQMLGVVLASVLDDHQTYRLQFTVEANEQADTAPIFSAQRPAWMGAGTPKGPDGTVKAVHTGKYEITGVMYMQNGTYIAVEEDDRTTVVNERLNDAIMRTLYQFVDKNISLDVTLTLEVYPVAEARQHPKSSSFRIPA